MRHVDDVTSTVSYGSWFWRASGNRLFGDDVIAELFGIDPERLKAGVPAAEIEQALAPTDLDRIRALAQQAVERNAPYKAVYQVRPTGGAARWVMSQGQCYLDENGQVSEFIGTTAPLSALDDLAPSLGRLTDLLLDAYEIAEAIDERTIQAFLHTVLTDIGRREAKAMRADEEDQ